MQVLFTNETSFISKKLGRFDSPFNFCQKVRQILFTDKISLRSLTSPVNCRGKLTLKEVAMGVFLTSEIYIRNLAISYSPLEFTFKM